MAPSESRRRSRLLGTRRLVLGVGIALALPLVVACNSIIGLSDFEKGECPGARCSDGGGFPDQLVDGGPDVLADVRADVKGADPVSWAKWPMPNYGEAGPGLPLTSPPLVADKANGVVTDPTTKLVWRSSLVSGDFSASEADAKCQALPNGPWRAPKRIELVTLLDYSKPEFVDSDKFVDLKNFRVWTTSEVRPFTPGDPNQAYWTVNFDNGMVEPRRGSGAAKVLCVRAR